MTLRVPILWHKCNADGWFKNYIIICALCYIINVRILHYLQYRAAIGSRSGEKCPLSVCHLGGLSLSFTFKLCVGHLCQFILLLLTCTTLQCIFSFQNITEAKMWTTITINVTRGTKEGFCSFTFWWKHMTERGSIREEGREYCCWRDGKRAVTSTKEHRQDIVSSLTFYVLFNTWLGPPDLRKTLRASTECFKPSVNSPVQYGSALLLMNELCFCIINLSKLTEGVSISVEYTHKKVGWRNAK